MSDLRILLPGVLLIIMLFSCLTAGMSAADSGDPAPLDYELALSFDIDRRLLRGTAHLTLPAQRPHTIFLVGIRPTAIVLAGGESSVTFSTEVSQLTIPSAKDQQELYISYEKEVSSSGENSISADGITLLRNWHPVPSSPAVFRLSARLPEGLVAFSEGDAPPVKEDGLWHSAFSTPVSELHFIAAPFAVDTLAVRDGLRVYSYFRKENRDLSRDYLQAARDYILRYEKMIGPYPYGHFAIVENVHPTGYAMPTFTLLGSSVLRLPFIKETSLGHEILHAWFGNSVEVSDSSGNWVEGLTSYLADWLYREEKGEGAVHRKESILKYHGHVTRETTMPLQAFTSASHDQPMAQAARSVGYIRGAMVFHELRKYIGDENFARGIRAFFSRFRGREAGWNDIAAVFGEVTGGSLENFFAPRLQHDFIPELEAADIGIDTAAGRTTLRFTLLQKQPQPFPLFVDLRVTTTGGEERFTRRIDSSATEIELHPSSFPVELVLDPEYHMLRHLDEDERVAVWSDFLGPRPAIVAAAPAERELFAPLFDRLAGDNWHFREIDAIGGEELASVNLILPGRHNPLTRSLFADQAEASSGLTLESRLHPLNHRQSVLLLTADSAAEVERALPRLPHYGKYSFLHFRDGRLTEKRFAPGVMGQHVSLAREPTALPASASLNLSALLAELRHSRVVYAGETHTDMADHHLQYLLIEGLQRRGAKLAIGMEMFPHARQQILDQYTSSSGLTERAFLKASGYFREWKYDYRLYRPIIEFARRHGIPLIGLNVDREIVGAIFREGTLQRLPEEQFALLPREMDVSLSGYYQRLRSIHGMHQAEGHGQGGLGGFILAQAVWDEVMAEKVVSYLQNNPDRQMIVLAGAQHVRKDSGIPPRVERRLHGLRQTVLLRQTPSSPPAAAEADYLLYVPEMSLPPAGMIGISLEETQEGGNTSVVVTDFSAGGKADAAGLRRGDRLLAVDGYPIAGMEDVRIAMVGRAPGETLEIVVATGNERRAVRVELSPPAVSVH